ncbi:methyl-accepting chemotaxis protein [Mitsuaria sp. BK037]|uniref:methyl-accepting chemotaxis protein n=1 Tax=Mitsuaria sp. BK037 TaxID=2587122 RepID=UPI00160F4A91|nr:methyl-accepting chemotaxis protein [Mitsuaria sp. BK037]MBB3281376.1 methyl-accepting chemotaxis protein [Mitsuaria sp. BK037]
MTAFSNLKIGVRLTGGFAAVIALLIVLAVIGVTKISAVDANTEVILHDRFVKVQLAQTVENEVNKQLRAMRTALIVSDRAIVDSELAKLEASLPLVGRAIDQLGATVHSERGKAALQALVEGRAKFKDKERQLVDLIKAGKVDEGRTLLVTDILPLQTVYLEAVERFVETQAESMEEFGAQASALARGARTLMIVLSVIAVLLAVGIAVLLTRSITRPIAQAVRVAETVAAGDLTSTIAVGALDETGQLLAALRSMNDSLVRIVGEVRLSSESIATGSTQIATGSMDLSHRTEEQASSLEQTAAAMEEVASTVQRSADSARNATALAATASEVATRGGSAVAEIVATMRDISASSTRIADITGVIDGIAFQTNILALNAAVEAARAGEQGRGFAVVAGEVRTLAQRAATAAKEIRALIGENVSRVETGSRLVEGAGTTMDEIVRQIRQVAELITEIGTATGQQSLGIGEVSKAVHVLDQVTQQNAALVEESAAAADSLSQQARRLTELVGAFKLHLGR